MSQVTNNAWMVLRTKHDGETLIATCNGEFSTDVSNALYTMAPDEVLDILDAMYREYKAKKKRRKLRRYK